MPQQVPPPSPSDWQIQSRRTKAPKCETAAPKQSDNARGAHQSPQPSNKTGNGGPRRTGGTQFVYGWCAPPPPLAPCIQLEKDLRKQTCGPVLRKCPIH